MLFKLILAFAALLISACSGGSSPMAAPLEHNKEEEGTRLDDSATPSLAPDDAVMRTLEEGTPLTDTVRTVDSVHTVDTLLIVDTLYVIDTLHLVDTVRDTVYLTHDDYEATAVHCTDSIDNDNDGLTDCDDPSCAPIVHCIDP